MIGRNSHIEIERAVRLKQDAAMMRDAIQELDVFQHIFNLPCHLTEEQMFIAILEHISR